MPKFMDLSEQKYGRFLVIKRVGTIYPTTWECLCSCGTVKNVEGRFLRDGRVQSCGCLNKEQIVARATKHGLCHTPEWTAWKNAKARCQNPNHQSYEYYGGRGITMCAAWSDSFEQFYKDMGPSNGLTLQRIENNGNYEPSNCKWATWAEQMLNRRSRRAA